MKTKHLWNESRVFQWKYVLDLSKSDGIDIIELTVNTGPHFQEPLTPVPSHRGPGISGARAGAGREAGDTGRSEPSQPTPVHTAQVSDQQCSGDTGAIMLWPHVRVTLDIWHIHCTAPWISRPQYPFWRDFLRRESLFKQTEFLSITYFTL